MFVSVILQVLIDLLDDQSISATNAKMNGMLPFAVVGSMDEVKIGNKMVRARQYPWGTVQVKSSFENFLLIFKRSKTSPTAISITYAKCCSE